MTYTIGGKVYVDAAEMGVQAGMSRSAVLRLGRLRQVPFYEVGRRWLFNPEEFMAALRQGPGTTAAEGGVANNSDGVTVVPLRRAPP